MDAFSSSVGGQANVARCTDGAFDSGRFGVHEKLACALAGVAVAVVVVAALGGVKYGAAGGLMGMVVTPAACNDG